MNNNLVKILIAGEGGQGIQTIAKILTDVARTQKFEVSYIPHYGVEMRMGISFAYIQFAKDRMIGYPKFSKADILAVLAKRDINIPKSFISKATTIVNCIDLTKEPSKYKLPNKTFNLMCLGIIIKELKNHGYIFDTDVVKYEIKKYLGNKAGFGANLLAYDLGLKLDKQLYSLPLENVKPTKFTPLINQDKKMEVIRFPNLCKGCGLCLIKCPTHAISWSIEESNFISRPMPKVNLDKCLACRICEQICPDSAICVRKK